MIGLGVGVVGGAITGAILGVGDPEYGPVVWAIIFGIVGAPVGAFGGGVVGLLGGEDRWVTLKAPTVRPELSLTPDGRLGFGLSIPTRR